MSAFESDYIDLLAYTWDHGEDHNDRTGVGTKSLFGPDPLRIDLREGFPLLTCKKMYTRGIIVELLWFLNGRTDNQWLNDRGCTIWDEWATPEQCAKFGRNPGDLGPVYGKQWRNFGAFKDDSMQTAIHGGGVDQIERLLSEIIATPNSRRLIVSAWNPMESDAVTLPPCHTLFQCKVHSDRTLSLHLYMRSADLFLGVPFNVASYAFLTHMIAKFCGLGVRNLIISFGDVHVYKNHEQALNTFITREPRTLPSLELLNGRNPLHTYEVNHFLIEGYDPHPAIQADVAV